MMKTILNFCIALTAIFFVSCKNGNYDLKFNPPAGSKYKYIIVMNQQMEQTMQGQSHKVDNTTEMYATYEILQSSGTEREMRVTYDRFKGSSNGAQYDTEDTAMAMSQNPMTTVYNGLKNNPIQITINDKGEVKQIKGYDVLLDQIVAAIPGDSAQKPMMKDGIKKIMGEDFIKSMIEQSFKIFPAQKVSVGDSWSDSMTLSAGINFKMNNTFTLKGVDNNNAKIDVNSKISSGSMEMMGMKIETDLKGTQTGTTDLDVPTGMTTASTLDQDIAGNMKVMGMEVPMKIKTKIKVVGTKI